MNNRKKAPSNGARPDPSPALGLYVAPDGDVIEVFAVDALSDGTITVFSRSQNGCVISRPLKHFTGFILWRKGATIRSIRLGEER